MIISHRANIIGVFVSAINMDQAIDRISKWIAARDPHYICVTPAHSVMAVYQNPELRPIFNQSGMTTPDGMAIVWLLRLMGHNHVSRVYGPDLMHALCQRSLEHGFRHYFYGSSPEVLKALEENLRQAYPGLAVAGHYSPPFGPVSAEEGKQIEEHIRTASPDILWVGISSPKQELWMAEHVSRLDVPVLIGVGAAFDFLSGKKKQAPSWMQRVGLEWFFRLLTEPRRLWRRYAQYPLFILLLLAQATGLKKFDPRDKP